MKRASLRRASLRRASLGRASLCLGLALLGLALPASPAAGDARDKYRQGIDAAEAGRWEEAAVLFRSAITESADEKAGPFRRTYFPHFHLGVALAELGDCENALRAWAESERQGQIQKGKDDELGRLQAARGRCQRLLQELSAARERARAAIARAREAAGEVSALAEDADLESVWEDGDPSFASREEEARELIRAAERGFQQHDAEAATLDEAAATADRAAGELGRLAGEARSRRTELSQRTAGALEQLEEVEGEALRTIGALTDLEPFPPQLGELVAAVQGDLGQIVEAKAEAGPDELARLIDRLRTSLDELRAAGRRPPARLQEAVELFLDGEYEKVVEVLDPEDFARDPRAAGHACLLRAASYHALFVTGGEEDPTLLASMVNDIEVCRALRPPPVPAERFYSPRFRQLYDHPPAVPEGAIADEAEETGS